MNFRLTTLTILLIGFLGLILGVSPRWRDQAQGIIRKTIATLEGGGQNQRSHQAKGEQSCGAKPTALSPTVALDNTPNDTRFGLARASGPMVPEKLLERAIGALEAYSSVSAKTRLAVCIYGKQLVGSGEYLELQSGDRRMLRLELKVQVHDEPSVLLQVCDGRYLWRAESYRGKGTAERIDLAQVARAVDDLHSPMLLGRLPGWPGLGGLPKLLRALCARFDFSLAAETTLPDQTPVIRLEGDWKRQALADWVPRLPGASGATTTPHGSGLPEPWPEQVVVYLGREDLFPFRIEFCRRTTGTILDGGAADRVATVTMDLFEVGLNTPIPVGRFQFSPGNLEYSDRTDRFMQQLGLKTP